MLKKVKFALNWFETKIADVIVPEVFNPYVVERTAELSAFFRSGIISRDTSLDELAMSGGRLLNMPYWKDLTGDDEVLSDASALTPAKITAGQDVSVLHMRGKAWSVNDLAKALSGDDPMEAIGDLVAEYWARRWQALLIASLDGVFGSATMAGNILNIAIEDGNIATDANLIGSGPIIDARTKLGDNSFKITGIAMHSVPYSRLEKLNLIEFEPTNTQNVGWGTYLGMTVIVDDSLPVVAGAISGSKYTSYLFGQGALGLGEGQAPVPTETDRDSLAGVDVLVNRRHFILHPRGVKWNDALVAGTAPTNAECATASNWTRVYENKNVRIVKMVTNG